jgi:aquaporin Z
MIGIGLVHALVLTGIVYAIGYRSGAQVNPAVTIGLLVAGKITHKEDHFPMTEDCTVIEL